jgi:hypothetical protein
MAILTYIPTNIVQGSIFSTSLPAQVVTSLSDNGLSHLNEMIGICGFDLNFPK